MASVSSVTAQGGAARSALALAGWLTLLGTVVAFWKTRLLAGVLLLPYPAWVTFAGVLNFTLWRLNR